MSSSLSRLQALPTGSDTVHILLFYRGEWCPFCTTWARGLSSIRQLKARLEEMNAIACFVSSQPQSKEDIAAEQFRFTEDRGLNSSVYFINDPQNKIASHVNRIQEQKQLVCVEKVPAQYVDGVNFPTGMAQPAMVVCKDLFGNPQILDVYTYDSTGAGGINGGDDRPPACITLRNIERLHANLCN